MSNHYWTTELKMEEPKPMQVAQIYDQEQNPMNGRVYSAEGISPTLQTPTGGLSEPCILGYTRDDKGNVTSRHEKEVAGTLHTSTGSGGNTDQFVKEQVIGSMQANAMRGSIDGVSPCLTEAMGMGGRSDSDDCAEWAWIQQGWNTL